MDRQTGFNLLQAAVLEGEYNTVSRAFNLLDDCLTDVNFETTGSNAKFFPGKTALDILLCLNKKEKGHFEIETRYKKEVEKHKSLTELHLCKCNADAEKAVELVVNEGVDINIPGKNNCTPLLVTSISSYIRTLVDLGADINVQRTDDKVAPLTLAANWNNYMATHILLESGADANIQDEVGFTPLHCCARKGFFSVSQLLIQSGCNINLQNNEGKSPLYVAVENSGEQLVELVDLLVKHGANVNSCDAEGFTPLHLAVINGKMRAVQKLVELGADVNLTTVDGRDSAELAQSNDEREIEEYLKSKRPSHKKGVKQIIRRILKLWQKLMVIT